jgi:hypothetical protein
VASVTDPYGRILDFLDRERICDVSKFFIVVIEQKGGSEYVLRVNFAHGL